MEVQKHITPTVSGDAKSASMTSLVDQFGRSFTYLRIAINEDCNLRCIYCMPEKGIDSSKLKTMMSPIEISRILRVSTELGINKVRFTGGEPLMYPDIVSLIKMTYRTPQINSVNLTTNAVLLKNMIGELKKAGLQGVNISIDTLDAEKYLRITRRNTLNKAMEGLESALSAGISSIKINVVVLRGFNDTEFKPFAELTREQSITVRFIELMPFDSHQIWNTGKFMSAQHIIENLKQIYPNMSPTKGSRTEHTIYKIPDYKGKIAVIPAFSRSLCGQCNRIRITADGKIRNCLYARSENNILGLMQKGGTDDDLKSMLIGSMWKKAYDGWDAQNSGEEMRNSMVQIGG